MNNQETPNDGELFKPLDNIEIPEPLASLKDSYILKINQIKANETVKESSKFNSTYFKVAAVAIVFFLGWFSSLILNREDSYRIEQLKNQLDQNNKLLVLSLIQQSSSSDRLQAANVSYSIDAIDNQIISALVNALLHDDDPNVRMKCAEALAVHIKPDSLNNIFSHALNFQEDPFMQLMLINYLSSNSNPELVKVISDFLKSGKADEFVSSEVKKTLKL